MLNSKEDKIIAIRTVKNYPQAHNHLLIGKLLEFNGEFLRVDCRTFHFGASVTGPKTIKQGAKNIRIIPWARVEIINELSSDFDYAQAELENDDAYRIMLRDGRNSYVIHASYNERY